jgi:hypothetical protein
MAANRESILLINFPLVHDMDCDAMPLVNATPARRTFSARVPSSIIREAVARDYSRH